MGASGHGDDAERRLRELQEWFHERGYSLYLDELPDSRWVASYPAHGEAIGSGATAEGPTALDAALAAWAAFMDGRRCPGQASHPAGSRSFVECDGAGSRP